MKSRTGEHDLGYFDQWPMAMFEAMVKEHPGEIINHTTPNYGPLMYILAKILGVHKCLEIGVAQGWSSGFMATAIKENNKRYQMNGMYYGLDMVDKSDLQAMFDAKGLPAQFIHHAEGSVDYLQKKPFEPQSLDLVFIDGWHNIEYLKQEIQLVYPSLKGKGDGYLCIHDIYSFVEGAWPWIKAFAEWEYVRFLPNYGLVILRKMEGYDHNKIFWPGGDQKKEDGFIA